LIQILDNLFANAVKFTRHGRISVRVTQDSAQARVEVRDSGIGVDPAQVPSIFNAFYQIDRRSGGGGLGLGLALVRRLVELHGGEVEFHSEGLGMGSMVAFTLPVTEPGSPKKSSATPEPAPRRILVVDDQSDAAAMIGSVLERMGQSVRVAYNGEVALAIARDFLPEVAFVDLHMSGMNGAEVARRLRSEFPANELTLVALSGYPANHPIARGAPFDHHMLKPGTAENIRRVLNLLPVRVGNGRDSDEER
jgi:CheY-like chemotaxis protein